MSSFATRRRAEEFAAVVDGPTPKQPVGASDTRYDDLLALVGAMRAVPPPQPRQEFVAELRTRLLAEAATLPTPADTEAARLRLRTPDPGRVRNPRERRFAVAMGGLALVGATATMSVVAQGALPGEALYPLKRGIESAHAGLSFGDESKGSTLLASASTRLDEVERLGQDADEHEAEIARTLDDFTDQATQASELMLRSYADSGDDATINQLRAFTNGSMRSLADLDGDVPDEAQDEWVHAVTTLLRIDEAARLACSGCEGGDLGELVPRLPRIGTGYGTSALPALNLPDLGVPPLELPSVGGELPPGSVTQPSPGSGPNGGANDPTGSPTGLPTSLPTLLPTDGSSPGLLPTLDVTKIIDDLTSGPLALPSVDVTHLLGGVGDVVDDTLEDPLGGLLP
jgi:hypothetical protein